MLVACRPRALGAVLAVLACGGCTVFFGLDGISDGASRDAGAGTDADADDAQADAPIDPDLVGWWTFDEGQGTIAHDATGQKNDGTLNAGASWAPGKHGTSVAFGGAGLVLVPDGASLRTMTSDLTFATWLYVLTNPGAGQPRLMQAGGFWDVKLNGPNPQLTDDARYAIVDWVAPVAEWHHIAFTFERGVAITAYVDGLAAPISVNQFPVADPFPADTNGLALGGVMPNVASNSCNCRLDDVRFYRRALSAAEIAALAR